MNRKQEPDVLDFFSRYVAMRQTRHTPDEALQALQTQAVKISVEQRHELGSMIGAWETREGTRHKPRSYREPPPRPGPPPGESVICPNCGKINYNKEYYCYACGHILATAPATEHLQGNYAALDPEVRWGTAHFDENTVLVLEPRDEGAPIVIDPPDNQDVVVGRSARDSIMLPDVDLAPYRAEEHGVSRLHAAVRQEENTITISDLGSSNYTYINGQRLHAHEVRCLRDRDELRLGHLVDFVSYMYHYHVQ